MRSRSRSSVASAKDLCTLRHSLPLAAVNYTMFSRCVYSHSQVIITSFDDLFTSIIFSTLLWLFHRLRHSMRCRLISHFVPESLEL